MILFYKYLGFSLKKIKELLKKEDGEVLNHLKAQLKLMQKEKQKLLTLIETLEKTIESEERKVSMPTKEKFKGFSYQDNQKYKQAAIDLYGRDADMHLIAQWMYFQASLMDMFRIKNSKTT